MKSIHFFVVVAWKEQENKDEAKTKVKNVATQSLIVYSQKWRHQNSVSNLLKVINTDTRHQNDVIAVVLASLLLILNKFHTLFWCLHCWLWTSKYRLVKLLALPAWTRNNVTLFFTGNCYSPSFKLVLISFAKFLNKSPFPFLYVMHCVIWHHLCNLKNVKNTHGGM